MMAISSAVSSSISSMMRGISRRPAICGGPPAALPGDQLVAAVIRRPDQDRLQDAMLRDGRGELAERVLVEGQAGLVRVRVDAVDREPSDARDAAPIRVGREQADDRGRELLALL